MNDLRIATLSWKTEVFQPEGWQMRRNLVGWREQVASLAWALLHRLGALVPYRLDMKIATYRVEDQQKIAGLFTRSVLEIMDRGDNPDDYCAVMGEIEFRELVADFELNQGYMSLPTAPIRYSLRQYRGEYRGLKVHVIAGLSGMAMIPRVIVESPAE